MVLWDTNRPQRRKEQDINSVKIFKQNKIQKQKRNMSTKYEIKPEGKTRKSAEKWKYQTTFWILWKEYREIQNLKACTPEHNGSLTFHSFIFSHQFIVWTLCHSTDELAKSMENLLAVQYTFSCTWRILGKYCKKKL